jgi:MFS family permease
VPALRPLPCPPTNAIGLWRSEAVRAGLLVAMFASLFIVPFTTLLPVFARDLLGVGASGQGLLLTAIIQAYSPSEFRGRTMVTFHMNQVVMTAGSMLLGALSSLLGARWATASMGAVGTLAMIAVYMALPRARLIR